MLPKVKTIKPIKLTRSSQHLNKIFIYLQLVGRFQGATNMYKPVPNVEISWPNGLPVNMPRCGFRGELCVKGIIQNNRIENWRKQ